MTKTKKIVPLPRLLKNDKKGNGRPIKQFSITGELLKEWESLFEIEKAHGYDRSAIIRTCKGKQQTSYGFKWQYVTEKHFEIIGTFINKMLIKSMADPYIRPDGKSEKRYNVLCHCGKEFITTRSCLISSNIRSCNCLKGVQKDFKNTKHPLYYVYYQIKRRCLNPKEKQYVNYGGRGIKMCQEWIYSYLCFYQWAITNGYKNGLSIDRINNDGNYEPGNCRWANQKTQANNTRRNHFFTLNGETKTLGQWANGDHNIYNRLFHRVFRGGWDFELAFNKPVNEKYKNKKGIIPTKNVG